MTAFTRTCLALVTTQAITAPIEAVSIIVNDTSDMTAQDANCKLREAAISADHNMADILSGCVPGEAGIDTITFANSVITGISVSAAACKSVIFNKPYTNMVCTYLG